MYQQDDNIPTKSHSEFSRRDKRNGELCRQHDSIPSCVEETNNGMTSDEGMKEMFYLKTHSTHFIYCYMASVLITAI